MTFSNVETPYGSQGDTTVSPAGPLKHKSDIVHRRVNVRSYPELLSDDPAWPELAALAAGAVGRVVVLPQTAEAARACLEGLQVTTRSPLGAIAHETGGMFVDRGWVRVLGSGHPLLSRTLGGWNHHLGIPVAQLLIVADDVIGGVFAVNGGALGPAPGNVYYFAPDSLGWSDIGCGYGAWLRWVFTGDLAKFYEGSRWPGWETEVAECGGDRAFTLYPPPWTVQGQDLAKVSRRPAPADQVWRYQLETLRQLGRR